ncbi:MAG TPA: hypothetical protein VM186_11270 [Planctomycetota bacterium]|nr:hypothetical protein [Planctomycetota bacterium]
MKILVTVLVSLALTFGIMGCAPTEKQGEQPPPPADTEKAPDVEKEPPADEPEKKAPADEEEAPAETTPDDETAE